MPVALANQAQLIRSSQKDEYYQTFLRNNANKAFQTLVGSKRWLNWRREIELLSDVAYFGLTTFSGCQTLGEEYVDIVQVDNTKCQIPSWTRRGLFVLCHVFFPYLLDKVLVCLENELEGGQKRYNTASQQQAASGLWSLDSWLRRWMQRAVELLSEPQRKACLPAVFALQQGLTILHRLHVALFYISGSFYHLSKRAAGISYLHVMGLKSDDGTIRSSYRLLGAVSLLQLLITVFLQLNTFRQRQRARQEWKLYRNLSVNVDKQPAKLLFKSQESERACSFIYFTHASPQHTQSSGPRVARCILCLEERRHSTSTPCGHLFCWECITEWCNTKEECPLCREKLQPHRLVYLTNYS